MLKKFKYNIYALYQQKQIYVNTIKINNTVVEATGREPSRLPPECQRALTNPFTGP